MNTKLLINGKFVTGAGDKEDVLDPATGKAIAKVGEASEGQIDNAVKAAQQCLPCMVGHGAERSRGTAAASSRIASRQTRRTSLRIESQNCGKPYNAVLNDEIPAIADVYRFFAGAARTMHGAVAGEYLPGFTSMIRRDPVGVVASIAPWNYPLMMAAWKLAPALAGGNTVVIKPSEQTPLSTLKLATIMAELFPAGVVNVVCGRGNTVGAPLINHPGVAMISLTGDVGTGEKVLAAAAKGIKRTHLELGGKAPVIVFDDADLESVVGGVRTFGFYNAGQDCTAACRIYAGPKIYDKLVADLSSAVQSIKVGTQQEEGVEMGPLISAQAAQARGGVRRARGGRRSTSRSPRAARCAVAAGSSTSPRLSPARSRRTRSFSAKCSARWCPLRASRMRTRPSSGPTIPTTASRHPCGARTSARPCRWPRGFNTAARGSTRTSCS